MDKTTTTIDEVQGIGDQKFEKLKSFVRVSRVRSTERKEKITREKREVREETNEVSPRREAKKVREISKTPPSEKIITGVININTASKDELMQLLGIGDKRADAIIEARPFQSIEDVMKVKGIKEGTFAKIRDHIRVR